MQIARDGDLAESSDLEQISQLVPLADTQLLELGCGAALTTRRLAEQFPAATIVAMEVDQIQHEKNLAITDLPNVVFRLGGAEAIDLPDASIDAVIMLKSLHHVPVAAMNQAFDEISRVLRPGGLAYISEPVYAGDFNEILRLFNDEKRVREAAFEAIRGAVDDGRLALETEVHFLSPGRFEGFEEFERRVLGATHSQFDIDASLYREIRRRFEPHIEADGIARFLNPMRIDLLRKP